MARTHYETLGIKRNATAAEIRSAYRRIVLAHHPDRSKDPKSPGIFMEAKEAYDVLSEQGARLRYDESLDRIARNAQRPPQGRQAGTRTAPPPGATRPQSGAAAPRANPNWRPPSRQDPARIAASVQRLTNLFARGRHAEAEKLARELLVDAPRNAMVYAVLADLARLKGNLNEAAKMYAYAAQFEPKNPIYQRRYEELLSGGRIVEGRNMQVQLEHKDRQLMAGLAGGAVVTACGLYITLSRERPISPGTSAISTWTLGLIIMFFVSGLGVGIALSRGNMVDRFSSQAVGSSGKPGSIVPLSILALLNFWGSLVLYLVIGALQGAWTFSTTRLYGGVAFALATLAIAGAVVEIDFLQTLLWGGNIVYPGAILGWLIADCLRK